ncbi:hypothetical protein OQZ33_18450 [Pedobacter sp. MC2016-05]|uniref:hypothetical protein n=1 Tax=Pedobacter sp. MC2016-05 TaxID=2994474 RepID=UPI0022454AA7|nr:hypothetical protein [Pedobacter sp. MC2016-05]MCX2476321.1 hypothetical protein [Pedobacter sp. MC2016-05]
MKLTILCLTLFSLSLGLNAQMKIRDGAIINQQERMVFKSWDRNKFTPTSGFLGLNPLYWMTWGLHPNYPKQDLRPLGPVGPQTTRLALAIAMGVSTQAYKKHSDTLAQTSAANYAAYSPSLSDLDPLWSLYYSGEFSAFSADYTKRFRGLGPREIAYLNSSGLSLWYDEQYASLSERLSLVRSLPMERGSRILSYHRLLLEHRKLRAAWEDKKSHCRSYLNLSVAKEKVKTRETAISQSAKSDIEIANKILKNSKL